MRALPPKATLARFTCCVDGAPLLVVLSAVRAELCTLGGSFLDWIIWGQETLPKSESCFLVA